MRKVVSVIMVIYLVFASVLPVFAAATPSDADWIGDDGEMVFDATPSDAAFDADAFVDDLMDYPQLYGGSDDIYDYVTTLDLNNVSAILQYKKYSDGSTAYLFSRLTVSSDGSYGRYSFNRPSDFAGIRCLIFRIYRSALPPSGDYRFYAYGQTGPSSEVSTPLRYTSCTLASNKPIMNASNAYSQLNVDFYQGDASWMVDKKVSIGTPAYFDIWLNIDSSCFNFLPLSGTFCGLFEITQDQTDYSTAGGGSSSQDAQQSIADSSQQVAQNTASMADTLKEIVQTISYQLEALWDQMYNYMHLEQLRNDDKNTNLIINNQKENTNQITESVEKHGNFIIEGLKSLFIPSDQYFKSYFDDLFGWFSDRFGFLSFPIELFIDLVGLFMNSENTDCVLTLPSFQIMDQQLLQEQSFNLTDFLEQHFSFLLTAIRMVTSIYLIVSFVHLCERKYNEVMRN